MRFQTSLQCESCILLKFISYIGLKKINKAKNIPLIYDGCRVPEAKCPGAGSIQFLISTQRNSISTHRSGSALLYPSCTDLELQQVYLGRNRQVCKSVCTTSNRSSCSIEISSTEACKKLLQAQIIPRINSRRPVYANKAINQNCLCNKWAGTALQNFKGKSRHSMPIQCATRARLCKKPAKSLTLGFSQNSMAYYLAKRILVMPESATSVNQTQIPVKFFWDNDNPILSLIICTSGCSSPNF